MREQLRKGVGEALGSALAGIRLENPQLADQLFAEAVAAARGSLHRLETLEALAAYVLPSEHDPQGRPADGPAGAARRGAVSSATHPKG